MIRSDACGSPEESAFCDINLNAINLEVISKIEKELEVYDLISLVFLLYDVPDTALERLIILQRISRDIEGNHLNLLFEWALSAQGRPLWRQQFLEALVVCQLYGVIKKLGFHIATVKRQYSQNEDGSYINPLKKVMYHICENMTSDTFENFKKSLASFDMNVMQYDTCELVLLQVMSQKFITLQISNQGRDAGCQCKIENLAKIIDRESDLKKYATVLRNIENKINNISEFPTTSTEKPSKTNLNIKEDNTDPNEFNEIYTMINELNLNDIDFESDRQPSIKGTYKIKNKKRVGICCIFNQEMFYPSRESMEYSNQRPLEKRDGSTKDKIMLEKTMRSLNFDIITKENLNRKEMVGFIQDVLKKISEEDSVFMLCILSHGIRGCVYAADSVPIKVDFIQNLMDDTSSLHGIPKVLILQACQVDGDVASPLAKDSPQFHLRKTDFLVCWATAPEFAAYRHPKAGSLFIQILCGIIDKFGDKEHLLDLFTMVNNEVDKICTIRQIEQAPVVNHSLRKKLYLCPYAE